LSIVMKRYIPMGITAIFALILLTDYFLVLKPLDNMGKTLINWGTLIAAYALFLGCAQLFRLHIRRVMRRNREWWLSIWTMLILIIFFLAGLYLGPTNETLSAWYTVISQSIGITTNAILAFYVFSASYRVLRIRTLEASALMLAAVFLMLTNAPIGAAISPLLPKIGSWILDVPNKSAQQGIIMCIAVGTIALGIRTLIGRETGYLGITEGEG